MFADPFTTPITRLLPAITTCNQTTGGQPPTDASPSVLSTQHSVLPSELRPQHSALSVPVIGGMASGASQPGMNVLVLNDQATAAEDLQLLLDGQSMHSTPPLAAMLFSCNGRGERLFGVPNHDIGIIRNRLGEIPIAGFFAAGEFGPIGDRSWLHGHTASLAV